jgi:rare lipoprotein A
MRAQFGFALICAVLIAGCAQAPELSPTHLNTPDAPAAVPKWTSDVKLPTVSLPDDVRPQTVSLAPQPVATKVARAPSPPPASLTGQGHVLSGIASYYWQDQMTSSGERFDKRAMTAAHKTLPLGTRVRVTHVASGRSIVVRINDRGPFKPGRVIDLSEAAAEQLQMTSAGLATVKLDVVK